MKIETRKVYLYTSDVISLLQFGVKKYSYVGYDNKIRQFSLTWPSEITTTIIDKNLWVINTATKELICIVNDFEEKLPADRLIEKRINVVEVNGKEEVEVEEFDDTDIFTMIGMSKDKVYTDKEKANIIKKIQKAMKRMPI